MSLIEVTNLWPKTAVSKGRKMLKEIIKIELDALVEEELDLGDMDPSFDAVLARADYHINFAGYDQNILLEEKAGHMVRTFEDLAKSMRETISEYEIEGPQSLIFTFIGDDMDYGMPPLNYEFCIEVV